MQVSVTTLPRLWESPDSSICGHCDFMGRGALAQDVTIVAQSPSTTIHLGSEDWLLWYLNIVNCRKHSIAAYNPLIIVQLSFTFRAPFICVFIARWWRWSQEFQKARSLSRRSPEITVMKCIPINVFQMFVGFTAFNFLYSVNNIGRVAVVSFFFRCQWAR